MLKEKKLMTDFLAGWGGKKGRRKKLGKRLAYSHWRATLAKKKNGVVDTAIYTSSAIQSAGNIYCMAERFLFTANT